MPKSTPPRDPESAYFENLGRMNAAAGIQWLMPRLNSWLGEQLQSMLHGLGVPQGDFAKPVRNSASLAATEASLGLLVGEPRVKRKYTKRDAPAVRVLTAGEMIDGRYTKVGAAKVLGVSPNNFHHHAPSLESLRVRIPGTVKSTCMTYDAAAVEALAAQRTPAYNPSDQPAPIGGHPHAITEDQRVAKSRKGMMGYWAGKSKEERRAIMHERFAKRTDGWAGAMQDRMAQGLPPRAKRKPRVIDVTLPSVKIDKSKGGYPAPEMRDGRYTLQGAAQILEVAVSTAREVIRKAKIKPITFATGEFPTTHLNTYDPKDIDKLADTRRQGVRK